LIKKIVHLADLHIRTYKRHEEYRELFKVLISDLSKLKESFTFDEVRVVIAGDIFHQKINISNEAVMMVYKLFDEISNIFPLIIIAGNHDLNESNIDRLDSITPIVEMLNKPTIRYYKKSECYLDDNIVWCIYSIFEGNNRPDIEGGRLLHGNDKTYVGLYHAPVIGAVTDVGFHFYEGTSLDVFNGLDICLMGDIHKRDVFYHSWDDKINNISKNNIPISYVGSFAQQNFGESVNGHGYIIWDVNDVTYEEVDVKSDYGYYTLELNGISYIDDDLPEHVE